MDWGVVSDCRPQAFAARTAAENFKNGGLARFLLKPLGYRSQRDRRSQKP